MKQGLLLIDIQNDYFTGGAMELVGMEAAAANAAKVLERFRKKGLPIYHIQHSSNHHGATFFIPGTSGMDIHKSVTPKDKEPVILKERPSAFKGTDLQAMLQRDAVDSVVIVGAMTHMCIDTTTRAARDLEFNCVVIADACATRALSFMNKTVPADMVQAAYMAGLNGMFADVRQTDEFLKR